ncbi:MAG: hypothetical protein WAO28_01775 [Candidatus Microsaccharimonas sp.]
MKSRIKEQGSAAHIVVIVVLVLAVLGLLGFVFWQNFMNKTETATSTKETATTADESTTSISLELGELGIKIAYSSTDDTYTATFKDTYYTIYSEKAATACDDDGNIGTVSRVIADEVRVGDGPGGGMTNAEYITSTEFYRTITKDNYIYILQSPQQACVDTSTDEGMTAAGIAEAAYKAFADDFEKLEVL